MAMGRGIENQEMVGVEYETEQREQLNDTL